MNLFDAAALVYELMAKHGLRNWDFRWNKARTICGRCVYDDHTIELSKHYVDLNSDEDINNTILHEIAHALVGPGHGHDLTWKLKAQEIGARPERCAADHIVKTASKWIGKCPGCGLEFPYYRRPKHINVEGRYSHVPCQRIGRESKIEWRKA